MGVSFLSRKITNWLNSEKAPLSTPMSDFERIRYELRPCDVLLVGLITLISGNAQRFECGSPNMLGAYALNASLSLLEEVGMTEVERRLNERVDYLLQGLAALPDISVISPTQAHRRAGIVTFRHKLISAPQLYQSLMDHNIICAHRGGGVRFSPHFYISFEKIDQALNFLEQ